MEGRTGEMKEMCVENYPNYPKTVVK